METVLILKALGLIATLGGGTWLAKKLLAALPHVDIHTKYAIINHIVDTVGNAAEDILKAILTSGDIDAILTALASGSPIEAVLSGLLPAVTAQVEAAAGPLAKQALGQLLGSDAAATARIQTTILSAAHDIWTAHKTAAGGATPQPGQVAQLLSGHLLVVPHGQSLPEGSKLVASLAKAA